MAETPSLAEAPLGSRPTALVLSGGAALGAWQGGVLWALEKNHGLSFPQVLGTSAGSVNGAAYFQGTTDLLRELWRDVPREAFLRFEPRLSPPSLFSLDSIAGYLGSVISEERCRAAKRCWFYAVAVDMGGAGTVQAQYSPEPGGPWDGPLLEHVLGSIAVPFVFPPRRLAANGSPARLFVDGHLSSFVDLGPLLDRGALDLLFVSVIGPGRGTKPRLSPRGYVSAIINQLMRSQVDNTLFAASDRIRRGGVRVFEFGPSRPLDISVFGFKKDECRRVFDQGVGDAAVLAKDASPWRVL
ncbi:MAG: patatin-like phospholipase family protein [Elusimicrobia bacterium]|nr:patatin-like phospholipase family protein [Elusimicrobiota bacterium]